MIVNFNRKIYQLKAIKEAIQACQGLAEFELSLQKQYFRVKIKNIDPAVKSFFKDEFANYVLGIINKK
jgi:hypothetical protein